MPFCQLSRSHLWFVENTLPPMGRLVRAPALVVMNFDCYTNNNALSKRIKILSNQFGLDNTVSSSCKLNHALACDYIYQTFRSNFTYVILVSSYHFRIR